MVSRICLPVDPGSATPVEHLMEMASGSLKTRPGRTCTGDTGHLVGGHLVLLGSDQDGDDVSDKMSVTYV